MTKKTNRTAQGLRDMLFDEIEKLQEKKGDPRKAMAVAHLARQIVNTAKAEIEFTRALDANKEAGKGGTLGTLQLGSA